VAPVKGLVTTGSCWTEDVERFMVYAEWDLGSPVGDDHLLLVNRLWDMADESFGSSIGPEPAILQLSFEVSADDEGEATEDARRGVEDLARRAGLPGSLSKLTGYTEEGWFSWTPQ
jgi:hypothetical protein